GGWCSPSSRTAIRAPATSSRTSCVCSRPWTCCSSPRCTRRARLPSSPPMAAPWRAPSGWRARWSRSSSRTSPTWCRRSATWSGPTTWCSRWAPDRSGRWPRRCGGTAMADRVARRKAVRRFGKVAVLFGGRSAEREISLRSGSMVLAALNRAGVAAFAFDPAERPLEDLRRGGFDAAFIALHGKWGEDGTVQGALEVLGIPYTGPGVMSSALAMDKLMTKRIWSSMGLPVPDHEVLTSTSRAAEVVARLGLPLIVKPSREGSTLGLTKVERASQLRAAWRTAAACDDCVIAESFVAGRELTVAVIGAGARARALPVIEIRAPGGNYDYRNKYFTDETEY